MRIMYVAYLMYLRVQLIPVKGAEARQERESLSAFLGTEDIGVHIVHISRVNIYIGITDLFHNNFPPSGLQPEHRKLAHEL